MTPNVVNLYHGGDLGDTVYAVPALRRLAEPVHLTLYPNHGVTRVLMDETNANRILPLLNAQPGVTADWKPTYEPDGLRLDFGVRRFYRNGFNLADIHSHWVGHDHWPTEHPWLTVDFPVYDYPIVVARSARYRDDNYPWKYLYDQFAGRACFVGVPWEHEDFERRVGKIPFYETASLLEAARVMAGADIFLGNQSCPRAVAEGLKIPVVVEVGDPNNTHFGRKHAYYPLLGDNAPRLGEERLEQIWCSSAAERAMGHSVHPPELLSELARLTRKVRKVPGGVLEVGVGRGGSAAVLAWALRRPVTLVDAIVEGDGVAVVKHLNSFFRGYHRSIHPKLFPADLPDNSRFAFAHIDTDSGPTLGPVQEWLLPRMSPGGIIVLNGFSAREIEKFAPKLGHPTPVDSPTNFPGLYTFQIKG